MSLQEFNWRPKTGYSFYPCDGYSDYGCRVISLFGAYLLSILLPYKHAFLYAIFIVFGLGIVLHRLFCVRTTVDKWLFTG